MSNIETIEFANGKKASLVRKKEGVQFEMPTRIMELTTEDAIRLASQLINAVTN